MTPLVCTLLRWVHYLVARAIRANRFARIIRNWNPNFYSTSGRFAWITRISDSRESPGFAPNRANRFARITPLRYTARRLWYIIRHQDLRTELHVRHMCLCVNSQHLNCKQKPPLPSQNLANSQILREGGVREGGHCVIFNYIVANCVPTLRKIACFPLRRSEEGCALNCRKVVAN